MLINTLIDTWKYQDGWRKGLYECNYINNPPFINKIRSIRSNKQGVTKACRPLCSIDWKRKGGILVLSDFQYLVYRIFVLSKDCDRS